MLTDYHRIVFALAAERANLEGNTLSKTIYRVEFIRNDGHIFYSAFSTDEAMQAGIARRFSKGGWVRAMTQVVERDASGRERVVQTQTFKAGI